MATTKAAATRTRATPFNVFVWEGTDKRGTKMKGEVSSKSANLVRADLRKQGINPTIVKEKKKPLFGAAGKRILINVCQRVAPIERTRLTIAGSSDCSPTTVDTTIGK